MGRIDWPIRSNIDHRSGTGRHADENVRRVLAIGAVDSDKP
jgi:hypothetical protein